MSYRKIGIIGAMEMEVAALKEKLAGSRTLKKAGMEFCEGTLCGMPAVIVRSGVGKVNAAVCTQILADVFSVDAVINTGVAGSLDARIDIGDIVISTDVAHHDVDATIFGYAPGEVPQLGIRTFPADERLAEQAAEAAGTSEFPPGHRRKIYRGRIVSGDQFIENRARKEQIKAVFDGMCTEMEGAAIAQAAWLNGIPFVIVRVISDKADESVSESYPVFEEKAAGHCAMMIQKLMERLAGQSVPPES